MQPPKYVLILVLGTCEYVRLHDKGELKLKMKLRLLISCFRRGTLFWIFLGDQCNTTVTP